MIIAKEIELARATLNREECAHQDAWANARSGFGPKVKRERRNLREHPSGWTLFSGLVSEGFHERAYQELLLVRFWLAYADAPGPFVTWIRQHVRTELDRLGARDYLRGSGWFEAPPKPEPVALPHVSTNPKAYYRFVHYIMFDDFGAAVQVLKDFGVSIVVGQYPLVERLMRGAAMGSFTNPQPAILIEAQGTVGFATE